jgi:hypothetical protein
MKTVVLYGRVSRAAGENSNKNVKPPSDATKEMNGSSPADERRIISHDVERILPPQTGDFRQRRGEIQKFRSSPRRQSGSEAHARLR